MRENQPLGPYVIVEKLGSGGMGEVYRARDDRLHREVAIKRLPAEMAADPDRKRALLQEARSVARISHQNVATLHDVLEEDDQLFLVMELVNGESLSERCRRPLPLDEILKITIQCAEGLGAAHRQGVVHGDVKPDNVLLSDEGQAKVLDFGVARMMLTEDSADEAHTDVTSNASGVSGTLSFMAPEVLLGNRLDGRADTFSLGVTLYRMLGGAHPFAGNTPAATVDRILHGKPTPVAQLNQSVPDFLASILDKMLAKAPDERYATMEDLIVDLRSALARITRPEIHLGPGDATHPPAGKAGRAVAIAVSVFLLAILAFVVWNGLPADDPTGPGGPTTANVAFAATDWVIAVLPVASENGDAQLEALTDGLAMTLTGKLSQMSRAHDLQVIPTSALRQREITDYASARHELGVTLAIDFQLRRIGDRLRANVNLIDTREDRQLAAATVDGSADDPIDLEEQVALRTLRLLRLELLPVERGLLDAGTENPRAHGYYLRAIGYLREYDRVGNVDAAIELLEQALRIDPEFARAQAALGQALWSRYRLSDETRWVERAEQECQAAAAADPDDGSAHRCLGTIYEGTGRTEQAADALEHALRLEPTDDATYIALANAYLDLGEPERAEATYEEAIALRPQYWAGYSWLGFFHLRQGRPEDAVEALQQVVQLAPDSYRGFSNLGAAYYFAEDWTLARQAFEQALDLNPDFHSAVSNIGTLYFYEGRYADAATMFERALELFPNSYLIHGNLADAYYWSEGRRPESTASYRRAVELANDQLGVNPDDAEIHAHVARYHAMLGDRARALAHLDRALAGAPDAIEPLHAGAQVHAAFGESSLALDYLERAVTAGYQRSEIRVDPLFEPLRQDPRYVAIMAD